MSNHRPFEVFKFSNTRDRGIFLWRHTEISHASAAERGPLRRDETRRESFQDNKKKHVKLKDITILKLNERLRIQDGYVEEEMSQSTKKENYPERRHKGSSRKIAIISGKNPSSLFNERPESRWQKKNSKG